MHQVMELRFVAAISPAAQVFKRRFYIVTGCVSSAFCTEEYPCGDGSEVWISFGVLSLDATAPCQRFLAAHLTTKNWFTSWVFFYNTSIYIYNSRNPPVLEVGSKIVGTWELACCVFFWGGTNLEAQVPENQTHVCHQLSAKAKRQSQYQSPNGKFIDFPLEEAILSSTVVISF